LKSTLKDESFDTHHGLFQERKFSIHIANFWPAGDVNADFTAWNIGMKPFQHHI
jgi:hypothetical protein